MSANFYTIDQAASRFVDWFNPKTIDPRQKEVAKYNFKVTLHGTATALIVTAVATAIFMKLATALILGSCGLYLRNVVSRSIEPLTKPRAELPEEEDLDSEEEQKGDFDHFMEGVAKRVGGLLTPLLPQKEEDKSMNVLNNLGVRLEDLDLPVVKDEDGSEVEPSWSLGSLNLFGDWIFLNYVSLKKEETVEETSKSKELP